MSLKHTTPSSKAVAAGLGLGAGVAGFLVGGTYAAAKNIRKVKEQEINKEEAVLDSLKEGGKTGLATGGAAVVTSALSLGPVLGTAAFLATGCGIKYWLDGLGKKSSSPKTPAIEAKEDKKVKPKTSKAKKEIEVKPSEVKA